MVASRPTDPRFTSATFPWTMPDLSSGDLFWKKWVPGQRSGDDLYFPFNQDCNQYQRYCRLIKNYNLTGAVRIEVEYKAWVTATTWGNEAVLDVSLRNYYALGSRYIGSEVVDPAAYGISVHSNATPTTAIRVTAGFPNYTTVSWNIPGAAQTSSHVADMEIMLLVEKLYEYSGSSWRRYEAEVWLRAIRFYDSSGKEIIEDIIPTCRAHIKF